MCGLVSGKLAARPCRGFVRRAAIGALEFLRLIRLMHANKKSLARGGARLLLACHITMEASRAGFKSLKTNLTTPTSLLI
jgi:hypothetical protein